LVSLYYSDSLSHPIPDVTDGFDDVVQVMNERRAWARSMTIDEYVVDRAPRTARVLMGYLPLLRSSTVRCFRYEEFIFEKEALMAGISEHFGWEVDAETTARLMTEVDVIPDTEDPSRFIRQVNPGNYLSKLRPDTIATLNRMLKTSMGPYGYAP
jgi:hypothetical protein